MFQYIIYTNYKYYIFDKLVDKPLHEFNLIVYFVLIHRIN